LPCAALVVALRLRNDIERMASLLDHPLIASRYFFPRRDPVEAPFVVSTSDGQRLACYRSTPHPGALTVLHFHGNAEIVADYVPAMADLLGSFGVNVVFAEYRGYGGSTGTPSVSAMLDDADTVFRAMGVPPERAVAFGRSLGSLFAVEVAARHPSLAGLVLESGIADPLEPAILRVKPEDVGMSADAFRAAVDSRVNQRTKLRAYAGPLLVLHAAGDNLIPLSHGERNFTWGGAPEHDKSLVVFPHGDHGTIFAANRTDYLQKLASFLAKVGGEEPRSSVH
jgi:pimeloyl-ACP methyl ester carboxylesterase